MPRSDIKKLFEEFINSSDSEVATDSDLSRILLAAENSKGVMTVILTSCYKNFWTPRRILDFINTICPAGTLAGRLTLERLPLS